MCRLYEHGQSFSHMIRYVTLYTTHHCDGRQVRSITARKAYATCEKQPTTITANAQRYDFLYQVTMANDFDIGLDSSETWIIDIWACRLLCVLHGLIFIAPGEHFENRHGTKQNTHLRSAQGHVVHKLWPPRINRTASNVCIRCQPAFQ